MLYIVTYTAYIRQTGEIISLLKAGTCKNKRYEIRMHEYKGYNPLIECIGTKTGSYKTEKRVHAKLLRLGCRRVKDDNKTEWFILPYNVTPEQVSEKLGFTPCEG